jgi:hypothetical protein
VALPRESSKNYVSEALLIDDTSKRELIKLYKRFKLDFLEDTRVRRLGPSTQGLL